MFDYGKNIKPFVEGRGQAQRPPTNPPARPGWFSGDPNDTGKFRPLGLPSRTNEYDYLIPRQQQGNPYTGSPYQPFQQDTMRPMPYRPNTGFGTSNILEQLMQRGLR